MFKRILSVLLCCVMVLGLVPAISLVSESDTASAASIVMPSNNGKTNNTTYVLGAGTDAEVDVICDWRSTSMSPTQSITPKYVMVHNTGTYVSSASAKNVHNNTNKTSTGACWHYTVDDKAIYQGLSDTRRGWHAATSRSYMPSNLNAIGIETCVNGFPATETFGGEQWNDGTAIMTWWENQFDMTMKHTAYLCLVLCERWGLNWKTDIVMHWDAWQYSESQKKGKDCPMQMRATYDEATNTFKAAGYYSNGRDGYFWKIFWSYLEQYAAGAKTVTGGAASGTTADKLGTYKVTASDGLNLRTGASTSDTIVKAMENGTLFTVSEISGSWGKATLADGTSGWCSLSSSYSTYIGVNALGYEVASMSSSLSHSFDSSGGVTLTNNSTTEQGQFDLYLPFQIGTRTTPYMSLQITKQYGEGYYFGLTQYGSGYWMMRDCNSSDQLVEEQSAPYMVNTEKLEINVNDWWKPDGNWRIDQVRIYVAPSTAVHIDYFYFAVSSGLVSDTSFNVNARANNINLMQPDTLAIVDNTKKGSYTYSNGMLKVVSDDLKGFEVAFNINQDFDIYEMKRLLVSIEAQADFNVKLLVTHSGGDGWVTLVNDFHPSFGAQEYPTTGYLSSFAGSAGLDLLGYYTWNGIAPANGKSTVKQVVVCVGGKGTVYLNALQINDNDALALFRDGVTKSGESTGEGSVVTLQSNLFKVSGARVSNVQTKTTVAAFLENVSSSYTVTVVSGDKTLGTNDIVKTGDTVAVMNGTTQVATYTMVVRGDLNCDGDMTSSDVRVLLIGLTANTLTDLQKAAADINGNGEVNTAVARAILKEAVATV